MSGDPLGLGHLDGQAWHGGCDDCDAVQTLHVVPGESIYLVHVQHDDTCPTLARMTRGDHDG